MSSPTPPEALLTLEPLLDAVKEGMETAGWELSGLQKTTSYEFEGRWAGDSSRSAYLFFHQEGLGDWVGIDAFLDETNRGLRGNLALVLDGPELGKVKDPEVVFSDLSAIASKALPAGYRTPLSLRYRIPALDADPGSADTEVRFKLYIPRKALQAGHSAVAALVATTARAFQAILRSPGLVPYMMGEEEEI